MKPTAVFPFVLVFGAMGCAEYTPPPNDQWAAAQADLGRAQSVVSPGTPDAKLHLRLAEEDLQKAKELIGSDNKRASTLTEVARVEAQLAFSLAKEGVARDDARKA